MLCFALVCIGDFELSQLSCLSSSVGGASRLECMRRGFESHLSAAFSLKKLSQDLCCVVLLCIALSFVSLFLFMSI